MVWGGVSAEAMVSHHGHVLWVAAVVPVVLPVAAAAAMNPVVVPVLMAARVAAGNAVVGRVVATLLLINTATLEITLALFMLALTKRNC